jgi:hypothetical protein
MLPEAGGEGAFVTRQMWLNKDCKLASGAGSACCTTGAGFSEGGAALGWGDFEHPPISTLPAMTAINKIGSTPFPKNIFPRPVFFIVL